MYVCSIRPVYWSQHVCRHQARGRLIFTYCICSLGSLGQDRKKLRLSFFIYCRYFISAGNPWSGMNIFSTTCAKLGRLSSKMIQMMFLTCTQESRHRGSQSKSCKSKPALIIENASSRNTPSNVCVWLLSTIIAIHSVADLIHPSGSSACQRLRHDDVVVSFVVRTTAVRVRAERRHPLATIVLLRKEPSRRGEVGRVGNGPGSACTRT